MFWLNWTANCLPSLLFSVSVFLGRLWKASLNNTCVEIFTFLSSECPFLSSEHPRFNLPYTYFVGVTYSLGSLRMLQLFVCLF